MTRTIALIFALAVITGCAGNYKTTFDHAAAAEPVNMYVAPILNEEEMDVQVVIADSSAATAQYGLIGALVGSIIDASINKAREREAERKAAVLRNLTASVDLAELSGQTIVAIGQDEKWQARRITQPTTTTGWDDMAAAAFGDNDVDAVVLLDFSYALTPGIDQVRVDVLQRVYLRETKASAKGIRRPASTRTFSYLSPSHVVDFRAFEDGEKAAMIDDLNTEYENRRLARPEAAVELNAELEKEIESLSELETIPERVAIRETWDTELLSTYLQQSADHLSFMLTYDWSQETVPEEAERTQDALSYINGYGLLVNDKGQIVASRDSNSIFRSQYGNMYSAPKPVAAESAVQ